MNYYAILGLEPIDRPLREMPDGDRVRTAWLGTILDTHPDLRPEDERESAREEFRLVMEAGLALMDRATRFHEYYTAGKLEGWANSGLRRPYTADPLPDWLPLVVGELQDIAQELRGEYETTDAACTAVPLVGRLPAYIPGWRLAGVPGLDVGALIDRVVSRHRAELDGLVRLLQREPHAIGWTWRAKPWTAQGAQAVGKARKLSKRERATYPGPDADRPLAELHIALSWWLVADDEEREHLVLHELLHFDVDGKRIKVRGHEVEAFAAEVEAFGIRTQEQAELVAAALRHPATAARLEHFGVLPDDQLVLFRSYFAEAERLAS